MIIAKFVVGKVVDRLMQSLVTGVTNKIKSLIPAEYTEAVEEKITEFQKLRDEFERKAVDTADGLLEKAFGVHIKDLEEIKKGYEYIQTFLKIVDLVRWGARVAACLSPPAVGCLWILAEALLEAAAAKIAETCWFQQKLAPLLKGVKYVTVDLPNKLGDVVIAKLKDFLPAPVSDLFADLSKDAIEPKDGETECEEEEGGDGHDYGDGDPLHKELDDLYLKIGDRRAWPSAKSS